MLVIGRKKSNKFILKEKELHANFAKNLMLQLKICCKFVRQTSPWLFSTNAIIAKSNGNNENIDLNIINEWNFWYIETKKKLKIKYKKDYI